MHPAKSVIYFTCASGAGYGLFILAWALSTYYRVTPYHGLGMAIFGTSFFLIITGLLASTLHLGHPERAWRGLTQWRSSWLSREAVVALLFFIPALIYAWAWIYEGDNSGPYQIIGGVAAALALITVFCTGKIYSTLKAVPAWHDPLTVPGYLILSLLTGGVLFLPISQLWFLEAETLARLLVLFLNLLGMGLKLFYWRSIKEGSSVESAASATGLKGKVTLMEGPHDQKNYLMKEMGFKVARKHAAKIRAYALAFTFMMPFAVIFLAPYGTPNVAFGLLTVAVFFTSIGIALERWLFFAEARHVQTLYYGEEEV
ncbi:MAG: dimethyl sulfoxide reductase anchor subunit family protein [Alphaproteobacteria bacterium]